MRILLAYVSKIGHLGDFHLAKSKNFRGSAPTPQLFSSLASLVRFASLRSDIPQCPRINDRTTENYLFPPLGYQKYLGGCLLCPPPPVPTPMDSQVSPGLI